MIRFGVDGVDGPEYALQLIAQSDDDPTTIKSAPLSSARQRRLQARLLVDAAASLLESDSLDREFLLLHEVLDTLPPEAQDAVEPEIAP